MLAGKYLTFESLYFIYDILTEWNPMIIKELQLRFGRTPGSPGESIEVTPVIIFVGPNNSGKSNILNEIHKFCISGEPDTKNILETIKFATPTPEQSLEFIATVTNSLSESEKTLVPKVVKLKHDTLFSYKVFLEKTSAPNEINNRPFYCSTIVAPTTKLLNGQNRTTICDHQQLFDLLKPPSSSFQILFTNDAKREDVRRIIYDAFKRYFVLDPTMVGSLRIRLSPTAPDSHATERGLHDASLEFHKKAQLIDTASDGIKAFTGIIVELVAGDPKVLIIDEPEAFLHPPLASKLGLEVARAAETSKKNVFVSTHSPSFLMGCVQSGTPITIIRLTYRENIPTARVLPSREILELMRNPLLRSSGVLSGLFYEFVVITESDADRAYYQEINERLLQYKPEWGIPNCLFIQAQNKQTIPTIMAPLRKLGIPAAGIVDIDAIKDGGKTWTNLLTSAGVPEGIHNGLAGTRLTVKNYFEKSGKNMKIDGGIEILKGQELQTAKDLIEQMNSYGVFIVPNGELESWMKGLNVRGHGPSWLISIFEKIGEDPNSQHYMKPGDDDVWLFMKGIRHWLNEPTRKGIPR